jgi:hypothetical protein
MTPEQIEASYQYIPQGVFTMENKAQRQVRLAGIRQQYLGAPWLNDVAFFDKQLQSVDETPEQFRLKEAEAMQIQAKAQMMADGMVNQAMAQKVQEDRMKRALPDVPKPPSEPQEQSK